jgi:hypothetical protein
MTVNASRAAVAQLPRRAHRAVSAQVIVKVNYRPPERSSASRSRSTRRSSGSRC